MKRRNRLTLAKSSLQAGTHAFTLMELITVMVIIAILAGALLPALRRARIKARIAKCVTTIGSLQTALGMYQVDYGLYPPSSGGTPRNGNSHHIDFTGSPNNLVAALTETTLGGPYMGFRGQDLVTVSGLSVLLDPWGQAYIYVCQKDITGSNVATDRGPFHPNASGTAKEKNTYNIYSLGPDTQTDDNDTTGGEIDYSQDNEGDTDDWNYSPLFDSDNCGHWNDPDENVESDNARYDDMNSWDGARSG